MVSDWEILPLVRTERKHCPHLGLQDSVSTKDTELEIKSRWPDIRDFTLHLHNGRGMALVSAYAALETLDETDTLNLDGTIGGIGGCPYCGNGRATGQMPTEDAINMLEEMGIDTGVDIV